MIEHKLHIGTKLVYLTEMTRGEYNDYRGWELPVDENPVDPGYLVEYLDGGGKNHPDHDNYISWSPKLVADRNYRPVDGMSFGMAIEMAKEGHKIARRGWNGKGMWVILVPGTTVDQIPEWAPGSAYAKAGVPNGCAILPHFDMYITNADGRRAMLPGWLASQTDMLADDWVLAD